MKYTRVALLMAGIVILSVGITAFTRVSPASTEKKRVVTSFYPLYTIALRLAEGIEEVEVVSLSGATTGCLHDFQLSPQNRITLDTALVLAVNGGGAETFLDAISDTLPVIDTSAGITLLREEKHANAHIWTSPLLYRRQVENFRDGLCKYDPENAAAYRANAQKYLAEVDKVSIRLQEAGAHLKPCVTFHDSLAYLAEFLHVQVLCSLSIGEEEGVSAADLREASQIVQQAGGALLLYDSQYPVSYADVGGANSRVLVLDTGVTGTDPYTAWLDAMNRNAVILKGAAS